MEEHFFFIKLKINKNSWIKENIFFGIEKLKYDGEKLQLYLF